MEETYRGSDIWQQHEDAKRNAAELPRILKMLLIMGSVTVAGVVILLLGFIVNLWQAFVVGALLAGIGWNRTGHFRNLRDEYLTRLMYIDTDLKSLADEIGLSVRMLAYKPVEKVREAGIRELAAMIQDRDILAAEWRQADTEGKLGPVLLEYLQEHMPEKLEEEADGIETFFILLQKFGLLDPEMTLKDYSAQAK